MMAADADVRVIDLHADAPDGLTIGGKAAGLARLARAGLPVPSALVIPAEATDQMIDSLAADVADRFAGAFLAVRSSGVAEDLEQASFAGQYETLLHVPARPTELARAMRRVRASVEGAGVSSYQGRHSTAMAVLVMSMVEADAAGIAFTRDPITAQRVVVIEAVAGLGDRLAAGEETGEIWRVDQAARRQQELGVLSEEQARVVAELALRCEAAEGVPQDVEWALAGGEVILLQARPITTVDGVEPVPMDEEPPPGPWEWDSTHNRHPVTPLTASVFIPAIERASRQLVELYGAPIKQLRMRPINGYLYLQVVPPAGKPGAPMPPKPIMRALFKLVPSMRKRARAARRAASERLDRRLFDRWHEEVKPEIEATIDEWWNLDLATLQDDHLARLVEEAVELQRKTFEWNMITDPAYVMPLADLNRLLETELGEGMVVTTRLLAGAARSDYQASVAALNEAVTAEGRDVILAAKPDLIDQLEAVDPAFVASYRSHLRSHGLRVLGFDLSSPVVAEDPALELSRIATMPGWRDPLTDAEALAEALRGRLGGDTAQRFDRLLAEARRTYPIREDGEAVYGKAMGILRLLALEAGRRMTESGHLEEAHHVVFLELDQLLGWLAAPGDLRPSARRRRGQHLWARGQSPAPFLGGQAVMPDPDIFPPEVQRIMRVLALIVAHDQRPAHLDGEADGVAASPGVHTGTARIVTGPDQFGKVQAGDILIAPITTSPWEVLFPHIGALVTEGGGLLSHPAIVAREYGLAAVVGCEGATSRFHDGQMVRVDGSAGTVRPVGEPGQP